MMHNTYKKIPPILYALIFIIFFTSCSNLISGETPLPLPYEEREFIKLSKLVSTIPNITYSSGERNIKFYVVAFDGTQNNQYDFDKNSERETIVAYLYNSLPKNYQGNYYFGPGYKDIIDSVLCTTCVSKAETAIKDIKKKISNEWGGIPNLEVRVIVLGFSRGAAIGRHFMNLLDENFQTSLLASITSTEPLVRTTAIMFDTVPTSVSDKLQLSISESTDYFIHIIAKNERRDLFYGVKDYDPNFITLPIIYDETEFHTCSKSEVKSSSRLFQIELPGSHSDIGSSYKNGIGTLYRNYGLFILSSLGLIHENQFQIEEPFYSQGYHDSRGYIDITKSAIFGERPIRKYINIYSKPLIPEEIVLLNERLNSMYLSSAHSFITDTKEIRPIVFDVFKKNNELTIIDNHSGIKRSDISYSYADASHTIKYRFNDSNEASLVTIHKNIWEQIPNNEMSRIEIILLKNGNVDNLYFYINCKRVLEYH
ncbi:hypothetical protein GOP96_07450 [Vibrio cholerae]|uniref:DUF2235 domain-containing protein n=2 Tax=Vibrio TaxID=662 RepID=UPI00028D765A|nr:MULTISPECIES: DUF2235 domain-containing protein [Vibrio]EKG91530.1 hypothetical protein VCHE16_0227 [Vibrio paracholerae HE-16]MBW5432532.1 hypothetical protein [Vibrio cholerae]MCO7019884.1 DUF2235 domain-containing protein [Vibrio paracholerae]MEB5526869.1 hypothetical protein [Vibrio cholerae]NAO20236.1 hypothetical protein [Vibrio cholerae]